MMKLVYKWLPIIFGCHCRSDRSFNYNGKKFPICARCTGELVGIIISCSTYAFLKPNIYLACLLMIPMVIDGFMQLLTSYESGNTRRFLSGIMFGYAFSFLFITSIYMVYNLGRSFRSSY